MERRQPQPIRPARFSIAIGLDLAQSDRLLE